MNYNQKYVKYTVKNNQLGSASRDCDDLIRIEEGSMERYGFTKRNIDNIIHKFNDANYRQHGFTIEEFHQHQQDIIETTRGCEIKIFNDPNVEYMFRRHFNGKPGTMSNILTTGYYILYNHLITNFPDLEINYEDDLKTIYNAVASIAYNQDTNNLIINELDYSNIKNIIIFLKSRYRGILFNRDWFQTLRDQILAKHTDKMTNNNYYATHGPAQQNLSFILAYCPILNNIKENGPDSWESYEIHPPFINTIDNGNLHPTDPNVNKYYTLLENLFNQ